jgi:hypothetical protein
MAVVERRRRGVQPGTVRGSYNEPPPRTRRDLLRHCDARVRAELITAIALKGNRPEMRDALEPTIGRLTDHLATLPAKFALREDGMRRADLAEAA